MDIEEGNKLHLDFNKLKKSLYTYESIVPVAVQNIDSKEVILLAYVNELAFKKALETKTAIFWSTSRNELWVKGKISGEVFDLCEVYVNCEQNSLLYLVRPRKGGICHTKNKKGEARNCYYRKINFNNFTLKNVNP